LQARDTLSGSRGLMSGSPATVYVREAVGREGLYK